MTIDPQSLYMQLGRLIETMPADIGAPGPMPAAMLQWLGRGSALLQATGDITDSSHFEHAVSVLKMTRQLGQSSSSPVEGIALVLHRALAKAELKAPAAMQGAFIPAGNAFDAMAAVGKVLQTAARDILVVDPYMDETALTDFAVLAPERVAIRLLADKQGHKPSLKPAVQRWISQNAASRPLDAKLAPSHALHDRLIAVDGMEAFTLTQSLNAFAARSPAAIVRVDRETAALKIAAYEAMWAAAAPL
jgi:hypothetical protein